MKKIESNLLDNKLNMALGKNKEIKFIKPLEQRNTKDKCSEITIKEKATTSRSIITDEIKFSLSNYNEQLENLDLSQCIKDKSFGEITLESVLKHEDSEIPQEIKSELFNIVDQVKELLEDNPSFLRKWIEKCFEVGEVGVYCDDVYNFILVEYPDVHDNELGEKLLELCARFIRHICFHSPQFDAYSRGKSNEFLQDIKDKFKILVINRLEQ